MRRCDLGGRNGITGYMRTTQFFGPGTYTLTFDLAGNIAPTTTTFGIADAGLTTGDWMTAITLNSPSAFTPYTETFTTAGGYLWVFDSYASAPNIGNFLDNVSLTFDPPDPPPPPRTVTSVSVPIVPVPEPSTWVMLLLGFAALGYGGYRRGRNSRVASLLS